MGCGVRNLRCLRSVSRFPGLDGTALEQDELDRALSAAVAAKMVAARLPATERAKILRRVAERIVAAKPDIAETMSRETGKAIKDSRTEIDRSVDTINLSAEEAVRIEGEHVPLDASPLGFGKIAMLLRFPIGVVAAITPFNAPVNLACHKIGPAIAAGNVAVLKAPPQCPGTIHKLVQCFVDAGLPADSSTCFTARTSVPALVRDERVEFHHLHRLDTSRSADQGRRGASAGGVGTGRHRPHHRARRRFRRGGGAALRAQRHAPGRPELHIGAERLCAREDFSSAL